LSALVYHPQNYVIKQLTRDRLSQAAISLAAKIPQFKIILDRFGVPPLWDRPMGFSTLLYIILEQQVSLASAKATYEKLLLKIGSIDPQTFLILTDDELKSVGFSRQKTDYGRVIAREIVEGHLNLSQLSSMSDEQVKTKLMSIKGIGHWTSDIYLLMVLLRPDVWPHGDRALAVAAYEVFKMNEVPDYNTLQQLAELWKPWRSVAARLLWHHYLSTSRKK
jgi:DNA-3-methyladenine glycosylase II